MSWRIKFRDADGRQVKRTIGREADGVTRKDAEAAARAAVVSVESKGWRKPPSLMFKQAAAEWFAEQQAEKDWKASTAAQARVPEGMRPLHEPPGDKHHKRRIAGANPVALTTKAGYANMATTRRYLRLAGVVFAEEAEALERRLLGGLVANPGTEEAQPAPQSGSS